MRIVLREDNDGHVYYDNDATTVEALDKAKAPADVRQPGREPNPGEDAEGLSSNRLAQWWSSVNPATVSKAVDPATGEPRVMYHGTVEDISTFDPALAGIVGERFAEASFFTSSPSIASGYAQRLSMDEEHSRLRDMEEQRRAAYGKKVLEQFEATGTTQGEISRPAKEAYDAAIAEREARKKAIFSNDVPINGANIDSPVSNGGRGLKLQRSGAGGWAK